ncbi:MAG: hypothetical protein M1820_004450 [Bogoriella megaspora]|nr:MAG: hypothetical protein M1820_004450 [Bogoriella megaspora]
MADAPELAQTPDERFPKYFIPNSLSPPPDPTKQPIPSPNEKTRTLSRETISPYPQTPTPSHDQTLFPYSQGPSTSKTNLPPISTVSPWNYASPPQYAVDTPNTDLLSPPTAQPPITINREPTDVENNVALPRAQTAGWRDQKCTNKKWRNSFWECWSPGHLCGKDASEGQGGG